MEDSTKLDSNTTAAYQELWTLRDSCAPIAKATAFLEASCSAVVGFQSKLSQSRDLRNDRFLPRWECFTSILALDLLENIPINPRIRDSLKSLLIPKKHGVPFNFFLFRDISVYPDDVDDTALATVALYKQGLIDKAYLSSMAELVISNVNSDGIIQTFLPPRGTDGRENRICPVVCANAMGLVYSAGLRQLASKTEEYLFQTLTLGEYLDRSEWYCSPDTFLYFLAKSIKHSPEAADMFRHELIQQVLPRLGCSRSPLESSLRILTLNTLQMLKDNRMLKQIKQDVATVRGSQLADGSWPKESFIKGNRASIYLECEELTTLFAVKALFVVEDLFEFKE